MKEIILSVPTEPFREGMNSDEMQMSVYLGYDWNEINISIGGCSYIFVIARDGSIKDIKIDTYQNEYYNKKIKEVILSVQPPEFYNGMDEEDLLFSVYLGYQRYDDIQQSVGYQINKKRDIFQIMIDINK